MKKFLFAICGAVVLAGAISVRATEYEYAFSPTSTTDGTALSKWGGELFLDASSSPLLGGVVSDIDQSRSWLETPFGTFYLDQATLLPPRPLLTIPPIFWTPTKITSMDIAGTVTLNEGILGDKGYELLITATTVQIQLIDPQPYPDTANGSWLATVPDSASTAVLIGLAAASLCGFGNLSRIRQLAAAQR